MAISNPTGAGAGGVFYWEADSYSLAIWEKFVNNGFMEAVWNTFLEAFNVAQQNKIAKVLTRASHRVTLNARNANELLSYIRTIAIPKAESDSSTKTRRKNHPVRFYHLEIALWSALKIDWTQVNERTREGILDGLLRTANLLGLGKILDLLADIKVADLLP